MRCSLLSEALIIYSSTNHLCGDLPVVMVTLPEVPLAFTKIPFSVFSHSANEEKQVLVFHLL